MGSHGAVGKGGGGKEKGKPGIADPGAAVAAAAAAGVSAVEELGWLVPDEKKCMSNKTMIHCVTTLFSPPLLVR